MLQSNRTITLDTPLSVPFRHRVTFTRGVFSVTNPTLRSVFDSSTQDTTAESATRRVVAFIDSNVLAAHPSMPDDMRAYMAHAAGISQATTTRQHSFPELTLVESVPGGETAKQSMSVVDRVVRVVDEHRIDRQSYVMAIGGGAVLDAVGFGASIAHRGVRLVRLPTTTLGQDDAGMAVKNGINLGSKKNFI